MRVMKVLIAGCGYVGSALASDLVGAGDEVVGLRRRVEALPPGVQPLACDLTDAATFPDLPRGLDAVVYAAAAGRRDEETYRHIYVEGLGRVLERIAGSPRLVFLSSTGVYGQDDGEWVDEDSPTDPASFTGVVMLEAESAVRASGLPSVVLRLSGLYGPGRESRVAAVREGRAGSGGPPRWTNRIHRDDAAGAVRHVLDLAEPAPVYVATDAEPVLDTDLVRWLADRLGVPVDSAQVGLARGKRCRNARLVASGFRLRYPTWREGYGALLA